MKGAVLVTLNEFVEDIYGLDKWERVLDIAKPKSGGIYTSVDSYDDEEVLALIHATCEVLELSKEKALHVFGKYLFEVLNKKHPIFTRLQPDLLNFLASVEDVVHKEVDKLFPDAYLPKITPVSRTENSITLKYVSKRKMCGLAEGIIHGAAESYGVEIDIHHPVCYHKGDDHCLLEVSINE